MHSNSRPIFGLGFKLAFRYFFGKKSVQAINIISWISVLAILISSAAMIILLSVENGFDGLLRDLYKVFYPELKVSAKEGKYFEISAEQQQKIKLLDGVNNLAYSIEDVVMIDANGEQRFATIKGIDENWLKQSGLDSFIIDGHTNLNYQAGDYVPAIIGVNLAAILGVNVSNPLNGIGLYYPNPAVQNPTLQPNEAFHELSVKPEAIFKVQADFDSKYIIVPIIAAQELLSADNQVSALELQLKNGANEKRLKAKLQAILGNNILVENRYEQNRTLWLIMSSEKWAIFAILTFVLLLSSFNMIGALSMLVIEKKKDISILKSMGAKDTLVQSIFLNQGMIMALAGGLIGVFIGVMICVGQQHFGWITLGDGAFIIDAYPVELRLGDVVLVLFTAIIIGLIASWQPSRKAAMQSINVRED